MTDKTTVSIELAYTEGSVKIRQKSLRVRLLLILNTTGVNKKKKKSTHSATNQPLQALDERFEIHHASKQ